MRLRVSQRERAAPRAAEDLPAFNSKMLAQAFDVGDEMPRRVIFNVRVRRALAGATLVEEDDAICRRIMVTPVIFHNAAARPAMQEVDRLAGWITALLIV